MILQSLKKKVWEKSSYEPDNITDKSGEENKTKSGQLALLITWETNYKSESGWQSLFQFSLSVVLKLNFKLSKKQYLTYLKWRLIKLR